MLFLGQIPENIRIPKHYLPNGEPLFWRHLAAYNFASTYVKNKIVLDIGCGDGYGAALLARNASLAIGIDKNPIRINLARTQYSSSNLTFLKSDIFDSNFAERTFDVIVAMQIIEHILNPDAFFGKVKHILKSEGIFLVSTPNKKLRLKIDEKPFNLEHVKEYDKDEFEDLLAAFFSKINLVGIVGNYEANKWERLRLKRNLIRRLAPKVLKLDFWNLRHLIPDHLRGFIIRDGRRVRRSLGKKISLESFNIRGKNIEEALDFIGICKME